MPEEMKRILSRLYVFLPDMKRSTEQKSELRKTWICEANVLWKKNKKKQGKIFKYV